MELLARLLARAVPDAHVELVEIACVNTKFFIHVTPNHFRYWERFKKRYSYSLGLAQDRGARVFRAACPEFHTKKDLIDWLSDTLDLTPGERNLLHLSIK
ncbi:hypothetical protein DRO59_00930 [Candidatus Bathyarchaeota archaeon]|nr:MAG: hypothetical protein DRO59_00930 [Candidatus Bathyarchaeota archaeon]